MLDFMYVHHVDEKKFFPFRERQLFLMCFLKIAEYTSMDNHAGVLYAC